MIGVEGDCEPPCECWLLSRGDDGRWQKEVKAGEGSVKFEKNGYAATCIVNEELALWRISITAKSYIDPNFSVGFSLHPDIRDRATIFGRSLVTALNGGDIVTNQNPDDQEYRLFTRGNLSFTCTGDNISSVTHHDLYWIKSGGVQPPDINTRVGNEGQMSVAGLGNLTFAPAPGIMFDQAFQRLSSSRWRFKWKYIGRPTPPAEVGFTFVRGTSRSSVFIWQEVEGECYCENGVGRYKVSVTGSAFPSHKAWFFDQEIGTLNAEDMENLWVSNGGQPDHVIARRAAPVKIESSGRARAQ